MISPRFIRYGKYVINIVTIEDIYYVDNDNRSGYADYKTTKISYQNQQYIHIKGNVVDELWDLIRLAMTSDKNNNDNNNNNTVNKQSAIASDLLHVAPVVEQPEVQVASEDDVA